MPAPGRGGFLAVKVILSIYLWIVGLLVIGIGLILGIVLSFLLPPKILDHYVKFMCRFLLRVMCIRVKVEGAETINSGRTMIFMGNHVSAFDVPLVEGYVPAFVRAVEAHSHFSWPIYGWAIKRFGNIPIRREDVHSSIRSIRTAETRLAAGRSLAIMPEGSRTIDGSLRPFKKLPFFLAKQVDAEIVPMGLSGLFTLKSKHSWIIRPTTIKLKFGKAISRETIQRLSVEELKNLVREEISKLIERP
jgi:1-acyl-sn-glycerol-3-phosphate acyltransferase